jgi:WD40 repeat protein
MRRFFLALLALLPLGAAQADCASLALVSGYFSGNVHVYDACTGEFLRLLDSQQRLAGPQAIRRGPDGLLYVASEMNAKVLRYRADTLDYVDTFITEGLGYHPLGFDFAANGDFYLSGFDPNLVNRYDGSTGALLGNALSPAKSTVRGPEIGTLFGPDGKLYVPGYYSGNVERYDPASDSTSQWINTASATLRKPRGILFEPGGSTALVGSESSGKIQRFRLSDGGLVGAFGPVITGVAGMAYGPDNSVLAVSSNNSVVALDATSGALRSTLVAPGSGGLAGATFIAVIPKVTASVDTSQIGSQFWTVGAGSVNGKSLIVDVMASATGSGFGSAFDPNALVRKRWGSLRVDFTGCSAGQLHWDSTGADSAGFGSGGYAIERLLPSHATVECESQGFANVDNNDWITGHWFGGASRSGEGFLFEVTANGTAIVAWFTHRPAGN